MEHESMTSWGSREEAIKCPHFMALYAYLAKHHNVPSYVLNDDGLHYHYTNASGLLGILDSNTLWATDIRHLNDPSESVFAIDGMLAFLAQSISGSDRRQEIVNTIKKNLATPREVHSVFSVSFCRSGDLLSQWRGYGSFGAGYSVGFRMSGASPHPQIAKFVTVDYGRVKLEKVSYDLMAIFEEAWEEWRDELAEEWATTIRMISHSFKDDAYKEEQESRIVALRSENRAPLVYEAPVKFRARGNEIVPYIPLSFNPILGDNKPERLPIREIIVGPGVDFERANRSLRQKLRACGYEDVEITPSSVPFRS
ncbi:hypothetical protein AGRO_1614 [Agrobacterium sp. ATCC 31749]|nr:hypothetical protein AGRO_1614 [Agrobacterium sp. ATCC 31749]